MRLLADENIPVASVDLLRKRGHDVLSISEMMPSASDEDVLLLAKRERSILLTFDKDFGELALSPRPRPFCGIILFRIPLLSAEFIAQMIADVLDARCDWPGHFAVVELGRIRFRRL